MSFPYNGVTLLAWLPLPEFGPQYNHANDCWGYISPAGREYAIIGLQRRHRLRRDHRSRTIRVIIAIVPRARQHLARHEGLPGPRLLGHRGRQRASRSSTSSHIDEGIVTHVDDDHHRRHRPPPTTSRSTPTAATSTAAAAAATGLRIYSLADPADARRSSGQWTDRYVHDAEVVTYTRRPVRGPRDRLLLQRLQRRLGRDRASTSSTSPTRQNIQSIARYLYPNGAYSHQAWLSSDRHYLLSRMTSSTSRPTACLDATHIIDVSDLASPLQARVFTNGVTAIDAQPVRPRQPALPGELQQRPARVRRHRAAGPGRGRALRHAARTTTSRTSPACGATTRSSPAAR